MSFLKDLGMTVNESKTEIIIIGDNTSAPTTLNINGNICKSSPSLKALGIHFDGLLKWDVQADKSIKKANGLISVFKHLRKYLSESQFLKTVTNNFYSSVYYASSVWMPNCKAIYKTKFDSLHFRLLRTATKDYTFKLSKEQLTNRCMRATPREWTRFTTSSIAMKIIRDKEPRRLFDVLKTTLYSERRNAARGLFFDSSRSKFGRQSLQNRLRHFSQIKEPWNELGTRKSNDWIRIHLKKTFFACQAQLRVV